MKYDVRSRAYMAGLVDSEGSITIAKCYENGKHGPYSVRHRLRLSLTNTSKAMVDWVVKEFGGNVHTRKLRNRKRRYDWYIGEQEAGVILELILPFMVVKCRQAELGLKFRQLRTRKSWNQVMSKGPRNGDGSILTGYRLPKSEIDKRERIRQAILKLNS